MKPTKEQIDECWRIVSNRDYNCIVRELMKDSSKEEVRVATIAILAALTLQDESVLSTKAFEDFAKVYCDWERCSTEEEWEKNLARLRSEGLAK